MSAVRLISAVTDRRYNFVVQRLRVVTSTLTAWTFHIRAVATEQDAHVHLVSLRFLPAKNAHHPLCNRERAVRDRAIQIDRDGAAEAAAFRAGAKRIVETEKSRARRSNVEIAMRAVPAGREGKFTTCSGGRVGRSLRNCRRHTRLHRKRNDIDFAFTKAQRGFDCLS